MSETDHRPHPRHRRQPARRLVQPHGAARRRRAAAARLQWETAEIGELPLFNQDIEQQPPEPVAVFKAAVARADAVLFVSPEYNYSIPGVLKNAIDWGTRPATANVWRGKVAAIMGASPGMLGTARMQYHLRQVLVNLGMQAVLQPEVMIAQAAQKFDVGVRPADRREDARDGGQAARRAGRPDAAAARLTTGRQR